MLPIFGVEQVYVRPLQVHKAVQEKMDDGVVIHEQDGGRERSISYKGR
ncbi:MAG: hypothetical protein ACRYG7_47360 [Janthinobacterium lividum]